MLTFRQFLECNDVDTSKYGHDALENKYNWEYGKAYRMYTTALALEMQNDIHHKAYVAPPAPAPVPVPVPVTVAEDEDEEFVF